MYHLSSQLSHQYYRDHHEGTTSDPATWQPHDIVSDRNGRLAMVLGRLDASSCMHLMNFQGHDVRDYSEFTLGLAALIDGYGYTRVGSLQAPKIWPEKPAPSLLEDTADERLGLALGA